MRTSSGIRRILAAVAALALAVVVVRNAAVLALADRDPAMAEAIWSGHPSASIALASTEIARAAGAGKPIGEGTFASLADAAVKAPLEPQPFIVRGIRLQLAGRAADAERAFIAARWRDPRSRPARYFLASNRLTQGNAEGLREVAALARLSPGGVVASAPYLAAFARQPQSVGPMRDMFRANPAIRSTVLSTLAQDPANLGLVIELGGIARPADSPWLGTMIQTLVDNRQYGQARSLWARIEGISDAGSLPLLFDPAFANASALPPFNWDLASSTIGLAERRSGRLQVIYYGQADGVLARQLLVLPRGRYRFAAPARAAGGEGDGSGSALIWTVRCAEAGPARVLASAPVEAAGLSFDVPGSCAAQWLELGGRSSDMGREREVVIGPVSLTGIASS